MVILGFFLRHRLRQEQYNTKLSERTRPATQICNDKFKKPRWYHKHKDWDKRVTGT